MASILEESTSVSPTPSLDDFRRWLFAHGDELNITLSDYDFHDSLNSSVPIIRTDNFSDQLNNSSNIEGVEDGDFLLVISAYNVAVLAILSVVTVATIVGNVFVIAAILLERALRTAGNYLVLSLALADLMVAALVMPLGAVVEIQGGWTFGPLLCDLWASADVLCCTASILHLLAIALDRYWAVTNVDYIHRRTPKRIGIMILCVWTAAAVVSIAPLFGWKDDNFLKRLRDEKRCLVSQDVGYQIFATISTFYGPLIFILLLYWKIFQVARKRIRHKPGGHKRTTVAVTPAPSEVNAKLLDLPENERSLIGNRKRLLAPSKNKTTTTMKPNKDGNNNNKNRASEEQQEESSMAGSVENCEQRHHPHSGGCITMSDYHRSSMQIERSSGVSADQESSSDARHCDGDVSDTVETPLPPTTVDNDHCQHQQQDGGEEQQQQQQQQESQMSHPPPLLPHHLCQASNADINGTSRTPVDDRRFAGVNGIGTIDFVDLPSYRHEMQLSHSTAPMVAPTTPNSSQTMPSAFVHNINNNRFLPSVVDLDRGHYNSNNNLTASAQIDGAQQASQIIHEIHQQQQHQQHCNVPSQTSNGLILDCARLIDSVSVNSATTNNCYNVAVNSCPTLGVNNNSSNNNNTPNNISIVTPANGSVDERAYSRNGRSSSIATSQVKSNCDNSTLLSPSNGSGEKHRKHKNNIVVALLKKAPTASSLHVSCENTTQNSNSVNGTNNRSGKHRSGSSRYENSTATSGRSSSSRAPRESLESKRERKAAKILAIITGIFVICWLPFFVTALLMPLCEACEPSKFVFSFFLWLGYLNSLLNPIIYTIFSPDFRRGFRRILCGRSTIAG